ncbi:two pore potassium channel protein sup-9 [Neodiprion pinetum]|uniref:Two pore potassium channel protein sup-9 n=1 Tax=Neodiprion lecontei TaxID=441921 RepID=A0A6J0BHQ1_NEOLC|nr:two pore potassium channel protein sup-9 [Neodiprion lecontei]XP_046410976.1 two pore potassium channel protein sup-9 [Neodiprion fabricii]XP_046466550.1 two pore potassium channel protein sup-9 [Neodiprion pinetum]XP_046604372.1 two pore potassium channel protein sup-9 [Neodiprion virginianus]
MKRQNVRTLSLVVCTFTYLLIGAAVFDALESDTERRRWEFLSEVRRNMMKKYNITPEDYRMVEIVIIENKPHKAGPQWKFAGAFYFATVVLAVIGYGHSTPVTIGGKAFCMAYAMVGIPLGLVMFQSIGERLNKFASVVIRRAKRYLKCQRTDATEMNLMLATGMLSSIIITTGAAVFSRYEGWSYFDSFYYCFVTLTTIGFGDYVALQNDQALSNKPGYVALSLVFILFGLAVVAASINLLVLRFMTMNTEDIRRDDNELQSASHHVLTLDGEVVAVNGKLLAGRVPMIHDTDDCVSVCSCTCLGTTNSEMLDSSGYQGYRPPSITASLRVKRASV